MEKDYPIDTDFQQAIISEAGDQEIAHVEAQVDPAAVVRVIGGLFKGLFGGNSDVSGAES